MTTPFWCIFIAWLLAYPPSWLAVLWMLKNGGFDNHLPRRQALQLQGFPQRAKSAHYNSLEALPGFAAGVLVAHLGGGDPTRATQLAVAFVAARCVYIGLYLADLAALRSTVWTVGMTLNGLLFLLPVLK